MAEREVPTRTGAPPVSSWTSTRAHASRLVLDREGATPLVVKRGGTASPRQQQRGMPCHTLRIICIMKGLCQQLGGRALRHDTCRPVTGPSTGRQVLRRNALPPTLDSSVCSVCPYNPPRASQLLDGHPLQRPPGAGRIFSADGNLPPRPLASSLRARAHRMVSLRVTVVPSPSSASNIVARSSTPWLGVLALTPVKSDSIRLTPLAAVVRPCLFPLQRPLVRRFVRTLVAASLLSLRRRFSTEGMGFRRVKCRHFTLYAGG